MIYEQNGFCYTEIIYFIMIIEGFSFVSYEDKKKKKKKIMNKTSSLININMLKVKTVHRNCKRIMRLFLSTISSFVSVIQLVAILFVSQLRKEKKQMQASDLQWQPDSAKIIQQKTKKRTKNN